MEFETVIGLEIHAQLKTASKIFCGCSTEFGSQPNTNTCPVCLGMPGVLPVLNRKVVDFAIRMGLATQATINTYSQFARKNYFYPDLPKGYQTSQYDKPIIEHGRIDIEVEEGLSKTIGITRMHMEEDAGKLVHDEHDAVSYVDLNRTGIPLLEIVSEPDMRSPREAYTYLKKIHAILRYLDICDGNMQEGSFRCDANISLRPIGDDKYGTRTELKNMNSFRHVQAALEYEVRRQRDVLLDGGQVIQQTLLWNPDSGRTEPMRGKEDAHDYRYFPCPDLVPIEIDAQWIEEIRQKLPELPDIKKERFIREFGLPAYDAEILTGSRELAEYFEEAAASEADPKKISNWMMTELLRELKGEDVRRCKITPHQLAELLLLVERGTISGKIAKTVFQTMFETGKSAESIVNENNLVQVSDEGEILRIINELLEEYPEQTAELRSGKVKLMGFFVGQLMKRMKGKANPALANELLNKAVSGD